jgi:hypothetical protein
VHIDQTLHNAIVGLWERGFERRRILGSKPRPYSKSWEIATVKGFQPSTWGTSTFMNLPLKRYPAKRKLHGRVGVQTIDYGQEHKDILSMFWEDLGVNGYILTSYC